MESAAMNLLLEISRFTAQAFVSGLWQGIVLISFVALCLRLLSRVSASVRFAVWGFAFALVVAIPLLHLHVLAVHEPYGSSAVIHVGAGWGLAIAGIWATLMAMRVIQLLMQAIRLHRIWRQAKPVAVAGDIFALLQVCRRRAKLCTSAQVDSPSVIGFFAPRLLIPEGLFAKLTEPELRQIVLHECEHLRRGDDWINLLQKVVLALFPLNPALLWVDRRLSLERELACDAGVVALTSAPFDYANCLTRLAEHRIHCRKVALSLSAWSRQSELACRVHSLLRPMRRMSSLQATISVALLVFGLAGGAVELARVPGLVSFTAASSASVEEAVVPVPALVDAPALTDAQAMPVVYRQTTQPHATLLKAVVPSPPIPPVRSAKKIKTAKSKNTQTWQPQQPQMRTAQAERVSAKPHIVLTRVTQPVAAPNARHLSKRETQPAYATSIEFSSSYAAIPFGDGWLIIQL